MDFRKVGDEIVTLLPTPQEREILGANDPARIYAQPEIPAAFSDSVRRKLKALLYVEENKELVIKFDRDTKSLLGRSVELFNSRARQAILSGALEDINNHLGPADVKTGNKPSLHTPPDDAC